VQTSVPKNPIGVVVVLHGGASRRDDEAVSWRQLSVLRMIPIARRLARASRHELAVFRLLNSSRGWDGDRTPVDDVGWALDQLRERFGTSLPTALVGHSLGGRAALLAGSLSGVRSVVALNPWVYPTDGDAGLPDRRVLVVHGTDDNVASLAKAETVARALARTTRVGFVRVKGGNHSMLRRRPTFEGLAVDFVMATLLDRPAPGALTEAMDGGWVDA